MSGDGLAKDIQISRCSETGVTCDAANWRDPVWADATVGPGQTDAYYSVTGLRLKAAQAASATTVAPEDGLQITYPAVGEGKPETTINVSGEFPINPPASGKAFAVYVVPGSLVSALPLTGANQTGESFIITATALALVAGSAEIVMWELGHRGISLGNVFRAHRQH